MHREAAVWASRTLRVGVGWGLDRDFLQTWLQALFSAGVTTVGTACLWTGSGAAQLSRNGRGGKGGRPPFAALTSHPLIRAAQCLNGPFLV